MPRKVFVAGEILTAADVNTNLMDQAVMVFDDDAARTTAIPTPTEGMVTYLKDTDALEKRTASAWVNVNTDSGKILQVVSTTKTDIFSASIASGAFSSNITGLTATITPSSSSSKILVQVSTVISRSDGRAIGFIRLMRGATAVGIANAASSRPRLSHGFLSTSTDALQMSQNSYQFLDSPSTTSATTYGVQLYGLGAFTFHLNRSDGDPNDATGARTSSTITVMEVAG